MTELNCVSTHGNASCHIWMSHVTYTNEVRYRYEWVMSCMNESRHIYKWGTLPIWMSHVMYEWVTRGVRNMSHSYRCICDVTHSYMTWPIHIGDLPHLYTWRDSFIYDTMRHVMSRTPRKRRRSWNVSWHIGMCHVTYEWVVSHIYMGYVADVNESCLIHVSLSHASCIAKKNESCLIKSCLIHHKEEGGVEMHHGTHECVISRMNKSCHIYEWGMWPLWMSHVTYAWVTSHI